MIGTTKIAVSLLPVLLFLAALVLLDSYKLVSAKSVLSSILAGAVAALLCLLVNLRLLELLNIEIGLFTKYVAPVIEEAAKSLYLFYLFRKKKIGFMVDGAIQGFAIGTGFALVENIYYLVNLESANLLIWVVRGFGTAAIHGATMVIFGVVSRAAADRAGDEKLRVFLPGFVMALLLHSFFNHFIFSPVLATIIILVVLPSMLLLIFDRSEKLTREWLGIGFDADQELLRMMTTGEIAETRVGRYLESIKGRFPGEVVADMFCLLRIHTELALRAKGTMMLRQAGIKTSLDPETEARLEEMGYLEKSIGRTGKLAIAPFIYSSSRDFWQLYNIK